MPALREPLQHGGLVIEADGRFTQVESERDIGSALDLMTTVARSSLAHFSVQSILHRYPPCQGRRCAGDGPASMPSRARVADLGRERRDPGFSPTSPGSTRSSDSVSPERPDSADLP